MTGLDKGANIADDTRNREQRCTVLGKACQNMGKMSFTQQVE